MSRSWYSASISDFLSASPDTVLGTLTRHSTFPVEAPQREAWLEQIQLLRPVLVDAAGHPRHGEVHFEFAIPRMGRRIDAILVLGPAVFVLEFKVGEKEFPAHALDQVTDYALDLKNFHETSHACWIAPVLIATRAPDPLLYVTGTPQDDQLLAPIRSNGNTLPEVIDTVLAFCADGSKVPEAWAAGR
jgi:hypothetical protein